MCKYIYAVDAYTCAACTSKKRVDEPVAFNYHAKKCCRNIHTATPEHEKSTPVESGQDLVRIGKYGQGKVKAT